MFASALDRVDWNAVPMRWFPTGWGAGDTDAIQRYAGEVGRQVGADVAVLSLIAIRPGGHIPAHEDGMVAGWLRVHLVLRTNAWCWSFHDDDWQQLEEGGIYRMDANKLHASVNLGESMRWHLIADRQASGESGGRS